MGAVGEDRLPEFKEMLFSSATEARIAVAVLNSNLFYWFVTAFSDCRHLNKREIDSFPLNLSSLREARGSRALAKLASDLMRDIQENSEERTMNFRHDVLTVQTILPKASKRLMDEIDLELAAVYEFTLAETDFLLNYDIKYRMGQEAAKEE